MMSLQPVFAGTSACLPSASLRTSQVLQSRPAGQWFRQGYAAQWNSVIGASSAIAGAAALFARRRLPSSSSQSSAGSCVGLRVTRTQAAPPRPPKEAPTPFPKGKLFPAEVTRLLELFDAEQPDIEELVTAMEDMQDLHESEGSWGSFPLHIADVPSNPFHRGLYKLVRGVLKCIEQDDDDDLRFAAVDLLESLVINGVNLTRCPPTFVVEAGAIGILCEVAKVTYDASVLQIILHLARRAPDEMLPAIIERGALDTCLIMVDDAGTSPMDQLVALDLILALSKRAPAKVAQAGAYETVKGVTNEVLIPRRNKIMNFLRPLVQHEEDETPTTNIRIGGLKF